MSRKLVTESELVAYLNQELLKYDVCTNCRFEHIQRTLDFDSEGCNWSSPSLRCSGVPASVCRPTAEQVAHSARKIFNLK